MLNFNEQGMLNFNEQGMLNFNEQGMFESCTYIYIYIYIQLWVSMDQNVIHVVYYIP